jgi:hypothetical protein
MRQVCCLLTTLVLLAGCGSGGGTALPVSGIVTMDNEPLDGASVRFLDEKSLAVVGHGRSGTDGKFVLKGFKGESGLPAGTYKVTVSKLKNPPTDEPVVAAVTDAELQYDLAPQYSNPQQTKLSYAVTGDGKPIEIKLTTKAK